MALFLISIVGTLFRFAIIVKLKNVVDNKLVILTHSHLHYCADTLAPSTTHAVKPPYMNFALLLKEYPKTKLKYKCYATAAHLNH